MFLILLDRVKYKNAEAVTGGVKIGVLKNFANVTEKHLRLSLILIKKRGLAALLKETPTQVFS